MRFLAFSDISWRKKLDDVEIGPDTFKEIIDKTNPDAIFFCGDNVYDSSSNFGKHFDLISGKTIEYGYDHFERLLKVLTYANSKNISCFILDGNHEKDLLQNTVLNNQLEDFKNKIRSLKNVVNITEKYLDFRGIKIVGAPYNQERSTLKKYRDRPVDIIIAHAKAGTRPFLFRYNPTLVISGHSWTNFSQVINSIFICVNFSPAYYVLIDWVDTDHIIISYYWKELGYNGFKGKSGIVTGSFINNVLTIKDADQKYGPDTCSIFIN